MQEPIWHFEIVRGQKDIPQLLLLSASSAVHNSDVQTREDCRRHFWTNEECIGLRDQIALGSLQRELSQMAELYIYNITKQYIENLEERHTARAIVWLSELEN